MWLIFCHSVSGDGIRVTSGRGGRRAPIGIYGDEEITVTKPREKLVEYMQEHGPGLSLRRLIGMGYPQHCKPLQKAMNWMLDRGGEVSELQRKKLK